MDNGGEYASRAEIYKHLFDQSVNRALDSATAPEMGVRDQARGGQADQNYQGTYLGTSGGLFRLGHPLAE